MNAQHQADEAHELDEGSWVYLSLWDEERRSERNLRQGLVEACESTGRPAVSWSPARRAKSDASDSARFFEGMSHAVEHADVVVVLVNGSSAMTDVELAFAYEHRRPIIGLCFRDAESSTSDVQTMLQGYNRARLIDCADADECLVGLREALFDPEFAATIHEAAGEPSRHA